VYLNYVVQNAERSFVKTLISSTFRCFINNVFCLWRIMLRRRWFWDRWH